MVEEGDDILLSGLIPDITVSYTFMKTTKTRTALSGTNKAQMSILRAFDGRCWGD